MPPQVYGWQHLVYLVIVLLLITFGIFLILRFVSKEKYPLVIKIIGIVLLAAIIWNRVSICLLRSGFKNFLPSSFCGTTSMALSLSAIFLKKNSKAFHSLAYVGLLGGLLTLFYPDFIGQDLSFFYPMTISGLVHHSIMIFLVLVMLVTGYLEPSLKKWYLLPVGLSMFMTYGIFLITIIGYNDAMLIYNPILAGTKLNWFYIGLIFLPFHALFLIAWEVINNKRLKKV
ncbi:MAG: YwaF family protein [Bacilli bacterium]|nr:YwaF family protein [Bacilli bacterium]